MNLITHDSFLVDNRYKVMDEIGRGSFGTVHLGYDKLTKRKVAIKFESTLKQKHQLKDESEVYKMLYGGTGIANSHYYGQHQIGKNRFNVLVLDLLGLNLEQCFNKCNRSFSLKTTLMLAHQILSLIEYLHYKKIIHRDIKPENFMVGPKNTEKENQLYIVDFGLSKSYQNVSGSQHIDYHEREGIMVGTARYASIRALQGGELSRRDDLESIAYMLVYFMRGSLPWQGLRAECRRNKLELIEAMKSRCSSEELCKDLPSAFTTFLTYARNLEFAQDPDYCYMKGLFHEVFKEHAFKNDFMFDWSGLSMNRSVLAASRGIKKHKPQ